MNIEQILFCIITVVTVLLFITEILRVDLIALMVIIALCLTGILDAKMALAGFSSEPALIVAAVFVMSAGLAQTGVTEFIASRITKWAGTSETRAIVVIMSIVALLSAFTHHLMITAMMLPMVVRISTEKNMPASRLLIPMATAASLGTTMTLIGAPAFLLAKNILERAGAAPLAIFSISPIGISITLISVLVILLLRWILPRNFGGQNITDRFKVESFHTELVVPEGSKWIGMEIGEFKTSTEKRFEITQWLRRGRLKNLSGSDAIEAGDMLLVKASPDEIVSIDENNGLAVNPIKKYSSQIEGIDKAENALQPVILQAVLSPYSSYVNQSIGQIDFLTQNLIVAGLWRRQQILRNELSKIKLLPNDLLLFWGTEKDFEPLVRSEDFSFISPIKANRTVRRRAIISSLIMAISIAAAAVEMLPPHVSFLMGALLMVLTRCLSLEKAYQSIDVKIFVMIAGVIPLGMAMEKTGVAALLATLISQLLVGWNPFTVLIVLFSASALLTQILSDAATTVLLAPIALLVARDLHLSPTAAVMTVAVGAVASFLTPIGHHGNLLILGPGRYKFADFLKIGIPLTLVIGLCTVFMALRLWP